MNKTFALLVGLAAGLPAAAAARTVQGVDWDAVPWATLCPNVAAVGLHSGAGDCAVSHPASAAHARWDGYGMGVSEPKPDCARLAEEYRQWTTPKKITGGKASANPDVTWGFCKSAFARALDLRARQPGRFTEPFEQWRQRFFGACMAGPGR